MVHSHSKLWDAYFRGEPGIRNKLVESYLPLVRKVVARLKVGIPGDMEEQDLISLGVLGLIDALERFDGSRGVNFEAYAVRRIKGTIIDELRKSHWAPRAVVEKLNMLQNTAALLEQKYQREVTEREIARELGLSLTQVQEILDQVNYLSLTYLEELLMEDSGLQVKDMVRDPSPTPEAAAEVNDLIARMTGALKLLPQRDRLLLTLYYYEELTLKEIGEIMGISESRVSQLHSRALLRLRSLLSEDEG